jgi:16S rRNA (guanine1516-N2)-methyltransferase
MIVYVEEGGDLTEARLLADKLNVPLILADPQQEDREDLILRFHKDGLSLCGEGLEMQGDLTHMIPRLKKNNLQREFLVKASRMKHPEEHPVAVDATAGMGEDSLLLAAAEPRSALKIPGVDPREIVGAADCVETEASFVAWETPLRIAGAMIARI